MMFNIASLSGPSPSTGAASQINQLGNNSLSKQNVESVKATLSQYDASNLSRSDATEIVSKLEKLGIKPGKDMSDAFNKSGFDAKEVKKLARKEDSESLTHDRKDTHMRKEVSGINESTSKELSVLTKKYSSLRVDNKDTTKALQDIKQILKNNVPENGLVDKKV